MSILCFCPPLSHCLVVCPCACVLPVICLSIGLFDMSICLSINLGSCMTFVCLSLCPAFCLSVLPSVYPTFCPSVCLSVQLSFYQTLFPCVCRCCVLVCSCHTSSRCLWTLSLSVLHIFKVFVDTVIHCVAQFPGVLWTLCHCLCYIVSRCLSTLSFSVSHSFRVFMDTMSLFTLFPAVDEMHDFTQAELDTVVVRVTLSPGVCG